MADSRATVAVIFGGRSVEHEVSVLTGLQFLAALDPDRYHGLPVYIDPKGRWWTGEPLRRRAFYPVEGAKFDELKAVTLPVGLKVEGRPALLHARRTLFGEKIETLVYDIAVPALHGSHGEDGTIQGLFEFAGVPYAGPRTLGAAATMDKHFTKELLRRHDIPVLPHALVHRPFDVHFVEEQDVLPPVRAVLGGDPFPVIVKPRRLGSSVGVQVARDREGLLAAVNAVFRLDNAALVEPLVPDLVEYNVAVRRQQGSLTTSAIERPLRPGEGVLGFSDKYLAGADGAPKLEEAVGEGLADQNREINPTGLTSGQERLIRDAARTAYAAFDLAGSARIDFLCNGTTGEIWLNEVNAIPGSFAYYLWQVAADPLSFTELAHLLIEEGFELHRRAHGLTDAAAGGARIFGRG